MNRTDCIRKTDELFSMRRSEAKRALAAREEEIAEKIPEIKNIEAAMRKISFDFFSGANDTQLSEDAFLKMKSDSLDLQKKHSELLYKNGYPIDYLELKYACPKCEDTGFIGQKMCGCYKKALSEEYMNCSSIKSVYGNRGFDKYDLSFFEGEEHTKMKKLFDFCKKYASEFSRKSPNLLMMGTPGCGKTYLSCAIGQKVIEAGNFVIYTPVQEMIDAFDAVKFGKNPDKDISIYTESDLLIIDDLGTEFMTQFSENVLYNVINDRINLGRPMIISTNFVGEDLSGMYHDRITSRVIYEFVKLPFCSKDIRHEKRAGKTSKK